MSDSEGRSATSRLASEGGEDWCGRREKPGKNSDLEDRDHRRGIDDASNLLVEGGADSAGIPGMGTVVILGARHRGVLGSGGGLVNLLMERLMPGRIRHQGPQQKQKQGAHDSANRGAPTRHGACFVCVQSVCIKGMRCRELNQNLQNARRNFLKPTVAKAAVRQGMGGVPVSEAGSWPGRLGRSGRRDEPSRALVRTTATNGCRRTLDPVPRQLALPHSSLALLPRLT